MAQTLSTVSAETKLKAVIALAEAFEIWRPRFDYLTSYIASTSPDKETRDAAILALNKFAQEAGGSFEDWEHYQSEMLLSFDPDPALGLAVIEVLTRRAG